jgi:DNA replication regulator SLD3
MSAYALQTTTMLRSVSKDPLEILGLHSRKAAESKPQLPTKRKRDSVCRLGTFTKPFVVKPCLDSLYSRPATFKPVRLIGRSQLPLNFLDTSPDESFASNTLFFAAIGILEAQDGPSGEEASSPKVLIARYEPKKTFYAIERVRPRVYSLCKLASWLKEKELAELWDPASLSLYPTFSGMKGTADKETTWWQHAAVEAEADDRPTKRPRMSMLRSKPLPTKAKQPPQKQMGPPIEPENMQPTQPEIPGIPTEAPTPQHLLEMFVQQYLDAVYLSKTSLAYFAKGPVTRLRVAFSSPEEGAPSTYDMVCFLRSMLLSHKASEKKYQDKLPEVIKALPPALLSDEEAADKVSKPRKSKKKIKLSRQGVYPHEEEIVKRWWKSDVASLDLHGEETIEQRIKRRIGDLRVRETLAQMILMLEIIALEALSTYKEPQGEESTIVAEGGSDAETQAKPKKRKKKLDDINLQLDLLLDKLCIWQSVEQIGILDFDSKPSWQTGAGNASKSGSDRLQSFCVEVIIPFYISRLPEQARTINKKLGGPVHQSPPKRKAMKPPVTSHKAGEPTEPESKKLRRTLGRVATDITTLASKPRQTPSLIRSSTEPNIISEIKREVSEVPLSAIPLQRSPSQAARRSVSVFNHLKGRQIDLSAPSAAAAAKLKQKQRVEEDLIEAIATLKKPNRGVVAGSYVDDIERRGLGSTNKSRKPTSTVRKVLKDVQVTATPRVSKRTKNMIEHTPSRHHDDFVRTNNDTPASRNFAIPSSSVVPGTVQRSVTTRRAAENGIAETPSKTSGSRIIDSPVACRKRIFATPAKPRAAPPHPDTLSTSPVAIFATPIKETTAMPRPLTPSPLALLETPVKEMPNARAHTALPETVPTLSKQPQIDKEQSIYDALGWNDDDDLF